MPRRFACRGVTGPEALSPKKDFKDFEFDFKDFDFNPNKKSFFLHPRNSIKINTLSPFYSPRQIKKT